MTHSFDNSQSSCEPVNTPGLAMDFFLRWRLLRGILELLDAPDRGTRTSGIEFTGRLLVTQLHQLFPIVPRVLEKLSDLRLSDHDEEIRNRAGETFDVLVDAITRQKQLSNLYSIKA